MKSAPFTFPALADAWSAESGLRDIQRGTKLTCVRERQLPTSNALVDGFLRA
jgi:hypothetical protein